jgi:hypothetical protein
MQFVIFLLLLWGAGYFYIWEHRKFERDLARLRGLVDGSDLLPQNEDWRLVARHGTAYHLRRAFRVCSRDDFIRYAVPVAIFCLLLLILGSWLWAFAFGAIACVKWFVTVTVLHAEAARYEVLVGHQRVFGGALA